MPATPTATRRAIRTLIVVVVLALLAGAVVVLATRVLQDPGCASPPTQQERDQQESFVKAHLPDARGFEWTVADCDDAGEAWLDFTTRQRGSVASRAFLRDSACKPSAEPGASSGDVTCTSGDVDVSLFFEDHGAIDTYGRLSPQP